MALEEPLPEELPPRRAADAEAEAACQEALKHERMLARESKKRERVKVCKSKLRCKKSKAGHRTDFRLPKRCPRRAYMRGGSSPFHSMIRRAQAVTAAARRCIPLNSRGEPFLSVSFTKKGKPGKCKPRPAGGHHPQPRGNGRPCREGFGFGSRYPLVLGGAKILGHLGHCFASGW